MSCLVPVSSYACMPGIRTCNDTGNEERIKVYWLCEEVQEELVFLLFFNDAEGNTYSSSLDARDIFLFVMLLIEGIEEWLNVWIGEGETRQAVAVDSSDVYEALHPVINQFGLSKHKST